MPQVLKTKNTASLGRSVSNVPPKPVLLYDGGCAFCRRWTGRLKRLTKERVDYAPYQEEAGRFAEIPYRDFESSIQLVDRDGSVFSGAAAAYRTLYYAPGWGWLFRLYKILPGFAPLSESVYRTISRHRHRF